MGFRAQSKQYFHASAPHPRKLLRECKKLLLFSAQPQAQQDKACLAPKDKCAARILISPQDFLCRRAHFQKSNKKSSSRDFLMLKCTHHIFQSLSMQALPVLPAGKCKPLLRQRKFPDRLFESAHQCFSAQEKSPFHL